MKLVYKFLTIVCLFSIFALTSCSLDAKRFDSADYNTKIQKTADNDVVIFPKTVKPKNYSTGYYDSSANFAKAWAKISKRKKAERKIAAENKAKNKRLKAPVNITKKDYDWDKNQGYVYPAWWVYYNGPNTGFRKYYRQYYYYGGPYNTSRPGYNQKADKRTRTTLPNGTVTYPYKGIYSKGKWTAAPGSTERPYQTHK